MFKKFLAILSISALIFFGCAGVTPKDDYVSIFERSPELFEGQVMANLGECVSVAGTENVFCNIAEAQMPSEIPERTVFIQQVDSNLYDDNLDGNVDMYALCLVAYDVPVFQCYLIDPENEPNVKGMYEEWNKSNSIPLNDSWHIRPVDKKPRMLFEKGA
jgi:hypothetical protein